MLQLASGFGDASQGADEDKMLQEPLNCYTLIGFPTACKNGIMGTWFTSVVSYCGDIPEARDLFCISHGTTVQKPHKRCFVSQTGINDLRTAQVRMVHDTREGRVPLRSLLPFHKSPDHFEYPLWEVAEKFRSKLHCSDRLLHDGNNFGGCKIYWRSGVRSKSSFYFWYIT